MIPLEITPLLFIHTNDNLNFNSNYPTLKIPECSQVWDFFKPLLSNNEKCDIKKGEIFKVLQENSEYYIVERLNSLLHKNWFVLKTHFHKNECIFTNDNNVIIKLINHKFSNRFQENLGKY